jgi:hypothetical protein
MLLVLALSSACDSSESPELDALDLELEQDPTLVDIDNGVASQPAPDSASAVEETPDFVLELDSGSSVAFYVGADGGVAMLEDVPFAARVASVLDDPRLADASPAVVWHLLTGDGEQIPASLREHHEQLAARGELAPLAEALAGLPRNLAPQPLADETSPCLNATFNTNHCSNPQYDDYECWFNVNGSLTWVVPSAERYKAGFCLQAGTARSWLYYTDIWMTPGLGCTSFRELRHYVWGYDSHANGTPYNAETYRSYVYWLGDGSRREYTLHADGDPGAVWDFGARYSISPCE